MTSVWLGKYAARLWASANSLPDGFHQPRWTMKDVLMLFVICGAFTSGAYLFKRANDGWGEGELWNAVVYGVGALATSGIGMLALLKWKAPVMSAGIYGEMRVFGVGIQISARMPMLADMGLGRPVNGWGNALSGAFIGYGIWIAVTVGLFVVLEGFGVDVSGARIDIDSDGLRLVVYMILVGLIFPAFEEVAFRGMLVGALLRVMPVAGAIVLSAAAFAAMHLSVSALPIYFCGGLYFGWLFIRTGSLWPCIGVHAAHNSLIGVMLLIMD